MTSVRFYRHENPSAILQFLKSHLPATLQVYHRIQSPQNIPKRHTLLLASFPPDPIIEDLNSPVTICFSDRSRHAESNTWIFNTLSLQATRREELSQESRQLLVQHLRHLLNAIRDVENRQCRNQTNQLSVLPNPQNRNPASTPVHGSAPGCRHR
jgi:uncharacterized membrane protein YccC